MGELEDIGGRIGYFVRHYAATAASFAERVGIEPSAVTHFVNRRNKPSFEVISGILRAYPRLSPDWLILGTGAVWRDEGPAEAQGSGEASPSQPPSAPAAEQLPAVAGEDPVPRLTSPSPLGSGVQGGMPAPSGGVQQGVEGVLLILHADGTYSRFAPRANGAADAQPPTP